MRATQAQPRTISCSSAPLWRCHALPASSATGRPRTCRTRGNRPCRSRHWEWLEGGAVAAAKTGYLAQQVGVAKRRELRLTQAWSCKPLATSDLVWVGCRSVTMMGTWCKGQDRFAFGRRVKGGAGWSRAFVFLQGELAVAGDPWRFWSRTRGIWRIFLD